MISMFSITMNYPVHTCTPDSKLILVGKLPEYSTGKVTEQLCSYKMHWNFFFGRWDTVHVDMHTWDYAFPISWNTHKFLWLVFVDGAGCFYDHTSSMWSVLFSQVSMCLWIFVLPHFSSNGCIESNQNRTQRVYNFLPIFRANIDFGSNSSSLSLNSINRIIVRIHASHCSVTWSSSSCELSDKYLPVTLVTRQPIMICGSFHEWIILHTIVVRWPYLEHHVYSSLTGEVIRSAVTSLQVQCNVYALSSLLVCFWAADFRQSIALNIASGIKQVPWQKYGILFPENKDYLLTINNSKNGNSDD
jgi:hypothetical protein